jgi:endonuclease/exonuclease/phosphatase family metal-dependent hydrolase
MNIHAGSIRYQHNMNVHSRPQLVRHLKFLVLLLALLDLAAGAPLRITTYNILNFPEALGFQRLDELRSVLDFVSPDIIVVQEIQSQEGVYLFLDSVMRNVNGGFSSAPFNDGPDTDNALFYRSDRFDYIGAQYHPTPNRDIAEYRLMISETQHELYLFSIHFKASQGSTNEAIREQEATILRERLNALPPGCNFIVAGDFNIYYSDEPAFQKLTDSLINISGRSIDPLGLTGGWHENSTYASAHTQSTRTDQLPDGGATGGLDDRFDMILCSGGIMDATGLYLIDGSYNICGNDAEHFDLSINDGYNSAVPAEIADDLYLASDHLPVSIELNYEFGSMTDEQVVKIWPNPIQNAADIILPWHDDFLSARIVITNILGQRVFEGVTYDPSGLRFQKGELPVGVYFLHVIIETRYGRYQYRTNLAIIK